MEVPELSTGIDRSEATAGKQLFGPTMSPFEAYLASESVLHQKLFNDEFVRTTAEELAQRGVPMKPETPGLHLREPNPRRLEFREHLAKVAQTKWQTPEDVVRTVSAILEESR
jgi:hypothetical protein